MRISIDCEDPGFATWAASAKPVRVYLGGVEISKVITADEERRFVVRHVTDERGNVVLNRARTETMRETVYGDVRIQASARLVAASKDGVESFTPCNWKKYSIGSVKPAFPPNVVFRHGFGWPWSK